MATRIHGVLKSPVDNKLFANWKIELKSLTTSSKVLCGVIEHETSSSSAEYDFIVPVGSYELTLVKDGHRRIKVGQFNIYSDSQPGDLNSFLVLPTSELEPAWYTRITQAQISAERSASAAASSASKAQNKAKAASDSAASSASSASTASNKAQLAVDKAKAASDSAASSASSASTASNKAQLAVDKAKAASDSAASSASSTSTAAEKAQLAVSKALEASESARLAKESEGLSEQNKIKVLETASLFFTELEKVVKEEMSTLISQAYDGTSEEKAVSEKALSEGLSNRDAPNSLKLNNIESTGFCRSYSSALNTGSGNWTTQEFVDYLKAKGAFSNGYFCFKSHWSYANSKVITDSGLGNISLAGAFVEVLGRESHYMIRITLPTTSIHNNLKNTTVTYVNHGDGYWPGWRKEYNTSNFREAQSNLTLPEPLNENAFMYSGYPGGALGGLTAYRYCSIEAVHPFTKGFEGPYVQYKPSTAAATPDQATRHKPYWYGRYHKGPRVWRGGIADGWAGMAGGSILKIRKAVGKFAGIYSRVRFKFKFPLKRRRTRFRGWVWIDKGPLELAVGMVNSFSKVPIPALKNWYFIDHIFTHSTISHDGIDIIFPNDGESIIYVAMPNFFPVYDVGDESTSICSGI